MDMTISPPLYPEQTQGKEQCVAVECGCSHCERHGNLAVHPLAKDVVFTKGLEVGRDFGANATAMSRAN